MQGKFFCFIIILALIGCTEDKFSDMETDEGNGIHFGIVVDSQSASRGVADHCGRDTFFLRDNGGIDSVLVSVETSELIDENTSRGLPIATESLGDIYALAFSYKGGLSGLFFEETAVRIVDRWHPKHTYYWPDSELQLAFFAMSPNVDMTAKGNVNGLSWQDGIRPKNENEAVIEYVTPSDPVNMPDLLVATTEKMNNSKTGNAVYLGFNHILSQVRLVVGDAMQAGTVESVTISGIHDQGVYNKNFDGNWTLESSVADITMNVNQATVGNDTSEPMIGGVERTLMLLPQTLPDGATLNVVFKTKRDGKTINMSAPLTGEWRMGMKTTYRISVNDYDIHFEADNDKIVDAHYVIQPIKIHIDEEMPGGWTLKSNSNEVTFRRDLTEWAAQGYWIESDKGNSEISGTETGDITVYAYYTGNISDNPREIKLELCPVNPRVNKADYMTVTQLCPIWSDKNIGFEAIEGDLGVERRGYNDNYEWGYYSKREASYKFTRNSFPIFGAIDSALAWYSINSRYGENSGKSYYTITATQSTYLSTYETITVDFDYRKLSNLQGVADDYNNGLTNTIGLYGQSGNQEIGAVEEWVKSYKSRIYGIYYVKTGGNDVELNNKKKAVIVALQKNKFVLKEIVIEEGDHQVTEIIPFIDTNDIHWYLPAIDELGYFPVSTDYPMSSSKYWSSTSAGDSQHSLSYPGNALELRDQEYSVRAVCRRP